MWVWQLLYRQSLLVLFFRKEHAFFNLLIVLIYFATLAVGAVFGYDAVMADDPPLRSEVLTLIRAHQAELMSKGVESITLFGSVARGDAASGSDVDLVIRANSAFSTGGFDHFGRLEALRERLIVLVGCNVDIVEEAAVRPSLREAIRREGVRAF